MRSKRREREGLGKPSVGQTDRRAAFAATDRSYRVCV